MESLPERYKEKAIFSLQRYSGKFSCEEVGVVTSLAWLYYRYMAQLWPVAIATSTV